MKRSLVLASALASGVALSWKVMSRQQPVDLKGKVAVITGATSAVGEMVAHSLAAEGASVVLIGRDESELSKVEELLAQYQVPMLSIPADVTRDGEVELLISTIMEHFGQIDVLINNAGVFLSGALQDIEPRQLRNMIAVNLYAPMRLAQRVLPIMLRQGNGHIVNVACATSVSAAPGETAYAATKAGLIAFSDALRRELNGTGIHVSIILPGSTETPVTKSGDEMEQAIEHLFTNPILLAEPIEVAESIVKAIRFCRREMFTGELPFKLGTLPARIGVPIVDAYYRLFGSASQPTNVLTKSDA
jgi:uncharacterized protein